MPAEALAKAGCFGGFRRRARMHRGCEVVGLHNPDVPPSTDPFYAGLGQAVRIGTELLASVIVGGGGGWLADTYLFGSSPWGIVIGLILGVAAGVRNAYRRAQQWTAGPPGGPSPQG